MSLVVDFKTSWNFVFKLFYMVSSVYIIVVMRYVYPRTREREVAWKLGGAVLAGSLLLSPFAMLIFERDWTFFTVSLGAPPNLGIIDPG